jgi:hypothetical protein
MIARFLPIPVLAALLSACPPVAPVVAPTSSCVTKVIEDALKGMTVQQIVDDAGPGCVTDAAQVITILLGSDSPGVAKTSAYREAVLSRPKP